MNGCAKPTLRDSNMLGEMVRKAGYMLVIDHLTVRHHGRSDPAIARLNLIIHGSACILGPSGAGKTTLLKTLISLHRPSSGRVLMDGVDLTSRPLAARRLFAFVPQDNVLPRESTLAEYLGELAILDDYRPDQRPRVVQGVLQLVHLKSAAHQRMKWLSGGMKRRALLASALMRRTPWLLLDEPTLGLDPDEQASVRSLLRNLSRHRRIIMATQMVDDANAIPDRLIIFRDGRVLAETIWDDLAGFARGCVVRRPWTPEAINTADFWAPMAGGRSIKAFVAKAATDPVLPPTPEDGYLWLIKGPAEVMAR